MPIFELTFLVKMGKMGNMEAFEFIFYIFIFIGVWFLIITLDLLLQKKGWKKRKGKSSILRRIRSRFYKKDNPSETSYLIKHRDH